MGARRRFLATAVLVVALLPWSAACGGSDGKRISVDSTTTSSIAPATTSSSIAVSTTRPPRTTTTEPSD